jgi:hypothetical protein
LPISGSRYSFWAQSNDGAGTQYRQLWLSTTSHGLFLLKRSAVHGPLETLSELNAQDPLSGVSFTCESWARLESSLTDGLRWGSGLSNNTLTGGQNRDYFSVDRRGVLSTLDATTSLMQPHTDSNGDIVHTATCLTKDGAITVGDGLGKTLVTAGPDSSTLQRRADPDSSTGFQVTLNGFVTVGGTSLTPEGALTTTQLITACNAAFSGRITAPSARIGTNSVTIEDHGITMTTATGVSNAILSHASNCRIANNVAFGFNIPTPY